MKTPRALFINLQNKNVSSWLITLAAPDPHPLDMIYSLSFKASLEEVSETASLMKTFIVCRRHEM